MDSEKNKPKIVALEDELSHAYCNFCQSHELRITKVVKVECKQCGKTRLITGKIR